MDNNLIPINDYAEMPGIDPATVRQRILRGAMPEAVKMANSWFVPRDLPLVDNRARGKTTRWKQKEGLIQ